MLGYLASDALQRVTDVSGRVGTWVAALVAAAVAVYVTLKWVQRRRVFHALRTARITHAELLRDLENGTPVLVLDLRTELDVVADPFVIPGALRIAPEELEPRHREIPRDRDVILYCS